MHQPTCVDAHVFFFAWSDEGWVEEMLEVIASNPRAVEAPVARPGSLWLSKATGRRGTLRWASQGSVRLDFSDTDKDAYVILAEKDLSRLYHQIQ